MSIEDKNGSKKSHSAKGAFLEGGGGFGFRLGNFGGKKDEESAKFESFPVIFTRGVHSLMFFSLQASRYLSLILFLLY